MKTTEFNYRGITAVTAALALSLVGASAQADKPDEKEKAAAKKPAKPEVQKKAPAKNAPAKKPKPAEKAEAESKARVEVRVRKAGDDDKDKAPGNPRVVRKGNVQIIPGHRMHGQELKPRPWLGIAMRPIPEAVREYLDLDEGFGVQVEHVVVKSPADQAGLKVHDVLVHLDDQRVISPEHVALLVRSKKKGTKLEIAFIRKGKEQKAQVTLGEKALPPFSNAPMRFIPQPPKSDHAPGHHRDHQRGDHDGHFEFRFGEPGKEGHFEFRLPGDRKDHEELRRNLEGYGDMLKKWMEKNPDALRFDWNRGGRKDHEELFRNLEGYGDLLKKWMEKNPDALRFDWDLGDKKKKPFDPPKPVEPKKDSDKKAAVTPKPIPPLPGKSSATGKPPAIMVRPGFPLEVFGGAGIVKIDNPKGAVTITAKDGKHEITIKNADGETVYEGPYNEGANGLPKEAQDQLKKMKMDDLKLLMPKGAKTGGPSKPQNKDKGDVL